MIQSTQDNVWPLTSWGVLGLAPKGDFFNYLVGLYDESPKVSLALKHTVYNKDAPSDDLSFNVETFINPDPVKHYKNEDVVGTYLIDTDEVNSWYLEGSISLADTEMGYPSQKICLDSYTNDLFGVVEGNIWCQRVRQKVCGATSAKDCPKSKADLSKAPIITLKLSNTTISFTDEDYIFFDSEGLQCRIGDPCTARSQETCPQNTEVVLGKLFMEKYTPILEVNREENITKLTLTKYFRSPPNRKMLWMGIGIAIVVVAVVGIIYIIFKRKKASDRAYYVKV